MTEVNFIGNKYGELIVINQEKRKTKRNYFVTYLFVKCSCGNTRWFDKYELITNGIINCRQGIHSKHKNLTNIKFNYLTPIIYVSGKKGWKCRCDCGNIKIIRTYNITSGLTKSCGCKSSELLSILHTLPNNQALKNKLLRSYKNGALKRNLIFELSLDQFIEIVEKPCFYCGCNFSNLIKEKRKAGIIQLKYNGIDRLDNSIGYILNNCVPCCKMCNVSKRALNLNMWLDWLERISNNYNKLLNDPTLAEIRERASVGL